MQSVLDTQTQCYLKVIQFNVKAIRYVHALSQKGVGYQISYDTGARWKITLSALSVSNEPTAEMMAPCPLTVLALLLALASSPLSEACR